MCGKAKVSGDLLGAEIFPVYKMHRRAYFLKMYFLAGLQVLLQFFTHLFVSSFGNSTMY